MQEDGCRASALRHVSRKGWYMAEKQSSRDRLKDITASIEDGIKELFQSESYAQYLQTMSRFHHYSVNNQVLIHMQKPDGISYGIMKELGWENYLVSPVNDELEFAHILYRIPIFWMHLRSRPSQV